MENIRNCFPSVVKNENKIFCENAGGTQMPHQVINKMKEHIECYNFQIDGKFEEAFRANILSQNARNFVNLLLGNKDGVVEFGSSTTQLVFNLSNSLPLDVFEHLVISDHLHECMVSYFIPLSKYVQYWYHTNYVTNYEELFSLITDKTTLVVLPHVCNVTGTLFDIRYIVDNIRKINPKTKIMVDGVSYLPHRLVDVDFLDVDFYFVSFYKFYASNISAVYIKNYEELDNLNHLNIEKRKLELGSMALQTNLYSLLGLVDYMGEVTMTNPMPFDITLVHRFYTFMYEKEEELIKHFHERIQEYKNICTMIHDYTKDSVCIFALKFTLFPHDYVTLFLNECNVLCKYGTFQNTMLFHDKDTDVIRISLAHYNTVQELEYIFYLFDELLKIVENHSFISNLFITTTKPYYYLKRIVFAENFQIQFNKLSKDIYYESDGHRLYSLVYTKTKTIVGNNRFIQSKSYNKTQRNNQIRHYQSINLIDDVTFNHIISKFSRFVFDQCNNYINYVTVHQIRVYISEDVSPIPEESIHQDRYSYVGILCVNRVNVEGGETCLYDNITCNKLYTKTLDVGEMIMFNDRKILHDVSNIKPIDKTKPAYRDVLVITTVF